MPRRIDLDWWFGQKFFILKINKVSLQISKTAFVYCSSGFFSILSGIFGLFLH